MPDKPLVYRTRAVRHMFERRLTAEAVRAVVDGGETIEEYPDDHPYPSRLVLGWVAGRPVHVVVAESDEARIVVTAYEPAAALWSSDFRRRTP